MHSGMIGKIEKAHRYAEDRSRFDVSALAVTIRGNNGEHQVRFQDGEWQCGCPFFARERACAHTMALELVLDGMIHEQDSEERPAIAV
ncbi:MAG: hypothetical protein M0R73_11590 [Dehalococcoidia bacterium]|nr:hypothetical protein [Dehalococcoidia bacterium]